MCQKEYFMLTCVKKRSIVKVRNMTHEGEVILLRTWLKKLREEKGLTQLELAELSNVERTTYASIEQGRRNPSVANAMRIAEVLDVEWTIFFDQKVRVSTQSLTETGG